MPRVSPTVAIAEATSNIQVNIGKPSTEQIIALPTINKDKYKTKIASELLTVSSSILRLKISVLLLRLNTEMVEAKSTVTVVIFIPPAVEPEEPPISIKQIIMRIPVWLITEKSAVLKPAVLGVTVWKIERSNLSPKGNPLNSAKKKYKVGKIIKTAVIIITALVWNLYLAKRNLCFTMSSQVKNPMPPIKIKEITVKFITGLVL